ncbi:hypothetical protein FJY90_00680 [Candidatus Gottesmanbacteria bacterium]|nr:hypothetical protein [Candidatus Gottesmanbacteria bacterium]
MNPIFLLITVVVYFIISFIIGLIRTRNITMEQYVVTKNTNSFIPLLFSILGIIVGGGMFFGVSQIGYEAGITGYIVGFSYLVGFLIMGSLVPMIRKLGSGKNYLSLIDLIEDRFKKDKERRFSIAHLFALINLLIFFLMLAAQFVVLGTFLHYFFGLGLYKAILSVTVVIAIVNVIVYSVFGGYPKDIATDVFQFIIILCGAILILLAFSDVTTWKPIATLPNSYFNGIGYGWSFTVGAIVFLGPALLVRVDLWQRIFSAKTEKVARSAFIVAAPLSLFFYVLFTTCGMYAKAIGVQSSGLVAMEVFPKLFPDVRYIIVMVSFFAAVLSSADTFLNIAGISFVKAIRRKQWQQFTESGYQTNLGKPLLRLAKLSVFIIGLLSVVITFILPDIVELFTGAFALLMVATPAILNALFSEKPNEKAAFHSMLWGFLVSLVVYPLIPKTAFLPGFVISAIVFFVIRHKTKEQISN